MKHILYITVMALFFYGCQKENITQSKSTSESNYLDVVEQSLKDSLTATDYQSLDFERSVVSKIDSLGISFIRVPLKLGTIASNFFIARTKLSGEVLTGRFVTVKRESSNQKSFTGTIRYRSISANEMLYVKLINGKGSSPASLKAEDPVVDGGELPPVIVAYTPTPSGSFTYADWYNLVDMAGDNGGYSGGYYASSSGGGGGTSPAEQVDFEEPESKDAIDVKKFMDCFGSSQPAGADYTISISVDLPVDGDPTKFFDWSQGSPGHTFITFYKNDNGNLVQQNIGFYPNTAWKTVVGPDNIESKMVDNGGHEYQAKYEITVTAKQFQNAINTAQNLSSHQYNIAEYNCADYALGVFRAAGGNLSVPQYVIPGFPSDNGSNTPEGVFNAIQSLESAHNPNAMANSQKQWAGNSHGACD